MEKLVMRSSEKFTLPTEFGEFKTQVFELFDGSNPIVLSMGNIKTLKKGALVRIHSECITGEVFTSLRCDCMNQLREAMKRIADEKLGVLIYLRQEGRGIGLFNKANAYYLQQKFNLDTVEANIKLGFANDSRDYSFAVYILKELGMRSLRLMTNNPDKIKALVDSGFEIKVEQIEISPNLHNRQYLKTKKERCHHLLKMV